MFGVFDKIFWNLVSWFWVDVVFFGFFRKDICLYLCFSSFLVVIWLYFMLLMLIIWICGLVEWCLKLLIMGKFVFLNVLEKVGGKVDDVIRILLIEYCCNIWMEVFVLVLFDRLISSGCRLCF